MEQLKDYLGDGVYAIFDGYGIWLHANDHANPTDRVYLEPSVLAALNRFSEQCNTQPTERGVKMSNCQQPVAEHKIDGNQFIIPSATETLILDMKPIHTMTFHSTDGTVIGTLDFNGPSMKFEGSAEDSAKVFVNFVAEYSHQRLAEERDLCAKLCDDADENTHLVDLADAIRRLK